MTALSFVLGVLPLVLASGAGAASRVSLGVTVFFGMLASAVIGTLMVPACFAAVQRVRERLKGSRISRGEGAAPTNLPGVTD
jgi:HAE1 family hydrophobic/amphiphilic exporter-1